MYDNLEQRNNNLEIITEIADTMFDEFLAKTQKQYERGSLYLIADLEVDNEFENYTKMDLEELKLFCATSLKTLKKFLGDNLIYGTSIFEEYSIDEKIKHSFAGKIEKIILTVEATIKS